MKIFQNKIVKLYDRRNTELYTLENNNGIKIIITNYGGIIT